MIDGAPRAAVLACTVYRTASGTDVVTAHALAVGRVDQAFDPGDELEVRESALGGVTRALGGVRILVQEAMLCSLGGHVWWVEVAWRYRCAARANRRLHPVTTEARAPSTRQVPSPRSTRLRAAYAFGITDERTAAVRTSWCSWAVVLRGHAQAKRRMSTMMATSSTTPRP
jgi:hypothetical protein